jgi:hypothetical protein
MKTCTYCDKYKAQYQPRTNCGRCWSKWFATNPGKALALKRALEAGKEASVVDVAGKKFVKMLKKFLRGEL